MTQNHFRALVAGQWLLFMMMYGIAGGSEGSLPEPLQQWLVQERDRSLTESEQVLVIVVLCYLMLSLVMSVGLVLFQPWAKRMLIPIYALGVILTMFAGPSVESSVESAFEYLLCILDGAVLAVVHLSPVREYFEAEVEE